jgi:hypothetical protein
MFGKSWKSKICVCCGGAFLTTNAKRRYCSWYCKGRQFRDNHPERLDAAREQAKQWYYANKARSKERLRVWRREHPERNSHLERFQRARHAGSLGNFSYEEWLDLMQSWDGRCATADVWRS